MKNKEQLYDRSREDKAYEGDGMMTRSSKNEVLSRLWGEISRSLYKTGRCAM